MKSIPFIGTDGELYEARCKEENSALEQINNRLSRVMPVETVSVDDLKEEMYSFNVEFQRSLNVEEAKTLVQALKAYFIQTIDKADKYYVSPKDIKRKDKDKDKGDS